MECRGDCRVPEGHPGLGCDSEVSDAGLLVIDSQSKLPGFWRAIADSALHFRAWGNEIIVYNGLSGDTHLLGLTAAQVLSTLQTNALDIHSIMDKLAARWQTGPDEHMHQEVADILAQLSDLSLIVPVES